MQYSCLPILEDSINKIAKPYSELASAVEATTHRLPTTGIIVPSPAELLQGLGSAEEVMNEILAVAGPHLDNVLTSLSSLFV
jgi:hypothetical protein